jgi:predicted phosphoribosyltransferase
MIIMSYKQAFLEKWNEQSLEDKEYFTKALALSIGQLGYYLLLKKMGAPKWAALGLSSVSANASFAPYKYAYDQRQIRLRRQIELAKEMDAALRAEVERERQKRRAQNQ